MGKRRAQPGFIIPVLALGDPQVASGLLALGLRAADEPLGGVEDGARAVGIPGEEVVKISV